MKIDGVGSYGGWEGQTGHGNICEDIFRWRERDWKPPPCLVWLAGEELEVM